MNWPTIIVASIIGAILIFTVVRGIINKKKGKRSCACGSCGACGMNCHGNNDNK